MMNFVLTKLGPIHRFRSSSHNVFLHRVKMFLYYLLFDKILNGRDFRNVNCETFLKYSTATQYDKLDASIQKLRKVTHFLKRKLPIKDFFNQFRSLMEIWSHLRKSRGD